MHVQQEIVSMAFSADSKMLAAQGGAPEWNMVIWLWEKSKVLASVKTSNPSGWPINQVSESLSCNARYSFTMLALPMAWL
jgi:hypothetical protein